jgi:hypothetical protein
MALEPLKSITNEKLAEYLKLADHINDLSRTTATDFTALRAQQAFVSQQKKHTELEEAEYHRGLMAAVEASERMEQFERAEKKERTSQFAQEWAKQVNDRSLRAEFALSDRGALKKETLPRDVRPVWESGDKGILHNAQTLAGEFRMDPRLAAAKKLEQRAVLGQQITEKFTVKLAAEQEKAALAWASTALSNTIESFEVGAAAQKLARSAANAADNALLVQMNQERRQLLREHDEAVTKQLDEARKSWGKEADAGRKVIDPLSITRATRDALQAEILRKAYVKEDEAQRTKEWSKSMQAVEQAASLMGLTEQEEKKERARLYYQELQLQAEVKAAQRTAEKAASKVQEHIADSGFLGALGRNARKTK